MNVSEKLVKEMLEGRGFEVLRNGWPDFLCIKRSIQKLGRVTSEGRQSFHEISGICAVEVKAGADKLRPEQKLVHEALKAVRIPVYVIRPDDTDKGSLKTRRFLTHAEIAGLEAQAERARDRLQELRDQAKALESYLDKLDSTIQTSSTILADSKPLLEKAVGLSDAYPEDGMPALLEVIAP